MRETIINLPQESGIYKIISPTGKIYIGETTNLKKRAKSYLNLNKIKNQRAIHNSLKTHGIESHLFEVVELCESENLKVRERYYQELFNSVEDGLNCFYTPTQEKLKKHSKETIEIMSKKSKGINNPFYGKKHSECSLKKISESSKGDKNPNYGGKLKNEDWLLKQKISNSKKPIKLINLETNETIVFLNSKDCAKFINVSPSSVRTSKQYGYKLKKKYIIQDV
jgi:group I intron endonuclease